MEPPTRPEHPPRQKRVETLISFAARVQSHLGEADYWNTPDVLLAALENKIRSFQNNPGLPINSTSEELDSMAIELWNCCTRLRRQYEVSSSKLMPRILLLSRSFAFLLLEYGYRSTNSTSVKVQRLMGMGVKAAKNALDAEDYEISHAVLTQLATYEEHVKMLTSMTTPNREECERHIAEYYILRTLLAWREDQLNIAEHMFKKSMALDRLFKFDTAENLADVLFEMGKDFFSKSQYEMAVKWLDRAYEIVDRQDFERLSISACELRTSIVECLVQALSATRNQENVVKASSLVEGLENELGDKLVVLELRLMLISNSVNQKFDSTAYSNVIRRMILTVALSETNFNLIIHRTQKLQKENSGHACQVFEEFMRCRILSSERTDWVEKVLINHLWAASNANDIEVSAHLEAFLSSIAAGLRKPVSLETATAAQMVLWKCINSNFKENKYDETERWCKLAMHCLLENSGTLTITRISRKLLLCALAQQDLQKAESIFANMPKAAQDEPLTRFLMYKIAIRCENINLATRCLVHISSSSEKDSQLLYACILDAKQAGNKELALKALFTLIEKNGFVVSNNVHLPSLIRITIGLTSTFIDISPADMDKFEEIEINVDKLCGLFEGATTSMKKCRKSGGDVVWTIPEIEWFSKNSYNLAIKHISVWPAQQSLRMLNCCIFFLSEYPHDVEVDISQDLPLRRMFCSFSAAIVLVVMARREEEIEKQLQYYLDHRKHVAVFEQELEPRLAQWQGGAAEDLLRKLSTLVAFDFEAACQLKAWDELEGVILKAAVCKSMRAYEIMADCILTSACSTKVLIMTLKKIVNEVWQLESLDMAKMAKYMRCLFQAALSDCEDARIAEELLEHMSVLAEAAAKTDQPYPSDELEWAATKSFNHAIDLYCRGEDDACRGWARLAMDVARFCADAGALEGVLRERFLRLRWDM